MKKVLVIAAHPASEILGCGGTIAAHCKAGDRVKTLILGEGVTARDPKRDLDKRTDELLSLGKQSEQAAKILGQEKPVILGLPDNRFDSVDLLDIVKAIEAVKEEFSPHLVYTHGECDLNIDNLLTHRATLTAFRPLPGHVTECILTFEVPSNTEWKFAHNGGFTPNYFVDISETLTTKLEALKVYAGEVHTAPHPRSLSMLRSLAEWRGASIGVAAAEAFQCIWQLQRISGGR